jgi:hypothetical protein
VYNSIAVLELSKELAERAREFKQSDKSSDGSFIDPDLFSVVRCPAALTMRSGTKRA